MNPNITDAETTPPQDKENKGMGKTGKKRKTCPPNTIRFEDLVPKTEVKGGHNQVLFGTLENTLDEERRKRQTKE